MANEARQPVPRRPAASTGFDDLRKEIAQRNEQAQKKARKIRDVREQAQIVARRHRNAL